MNIKGLVGALTTAVVDGANPSEVIEGAARGAARAALRSELGRSFASGMALGAGGVRVKAAIDAQDPEGMAVELERTASVLRQVWGKPRG